MNVHKSSIYANGVPARILQPICVSAGMKLEPLPFYYLGIPIVARKLSILECFVLVEKVVARIRALGSRHLSYGGRLALVKSVLATLHSYWARIFILPKNIIKRIEDTCRTRFARTRRLGVWVLEKRMNGTLLVSGSIYGGLLVRRIAFGLSGLMVYIFEVQRRGI
ncbi:hypothetical protein RND81_10G016600 [Saponaria officinalis]|uniref:Uncharacterized protein n=1 Tax=Saponaria officinalis TaxID=3572 RepID=A0AAW1HZI9_SAPOF